jgi:hypothetical protein
MGRAPLLCPNNFQPFISSLVRMDQTCFDRSGGFWPTILPLFQGSRVDVVRLVLAFSGLSMATLSMVTVGWLVVVALGAETVASWIIAAIGLGCRRVRYSPPGFDRPF